MTPIKLKALAERYHEGHDRGAREELIRECMPLVRGLARQYAGRGEPFDDLCQVGMIGLIKAVDRFDVSRGVAFTTYAAPTIIGEIKRHFRDRTSMLKISRPIQELAVRLAKETEALTVSLGRSPSLAELAAVVGADDAAVAEALGAARARRVRSLSLVEHVDGEVADPLDSIGEVDLGFSAAEARTLLEPALRSLTVAERRAVGMYFAFGLAQARIAEELGCAQMHVSRILRVALEKLRLAMSEHATVSQNASAQALEGRNGGVDQLASRRIPPTAVRTRESVNAMSPAA